MFTPLIFAGCLSQSAMNQNNDFADLDEYMLRMDNQKTNTMAEIPQFKSSEPFIYQHQQSRSPFDQPLTLDDLISSVDPINNAPAPIEGRVRQPLEHFTLDSLKFQGIIQRDDAVTALFSAPDGNVYPILNGQFLGEHNGQIQRITAQSVEIVEVVNNGHGGWRKQIQVIKLTQ